jgi:hypothetical protein
MFKLDLTSMIQTLVSLLMVDTVSEDNEEFGIHLMYYLRMKDPNTEVESSIITHFLFCGDVKVFIGFTDTPSEKVQMWEHLGGHESAWVHAVAEGVNSVYVDLAEKVNDERIGLPLEDPDQDAVSLAPSVMNQYVAPVGTPKFVWVSHLRDSIKNRAGEGQWRKIFSIRSNDDHSLKGVQCSQQ